MIWNILKPNNITPILSQRVFNGLTLMNIISWIQKILFWYHEGDRPGSSRSHILTLDSFLKGNWNFLYSKWKGRNFHVDEILKRKRWTSRGSSWRYGAIKVGIIRCSGLFFKVFLEIKAQIKFLKEVTCT